MTDKLTIQELKALCEFFFKAGKNPSEQFEECFNNLMQGKYDEAIKQKGIEKWWHETHAEIERLMEPFDREAKIKAHQAAEDLRNIILH